MSDPTLADLMNPTYIRETLGIQVPQQPQHPIIEPYAAAPPVVVPSIPDASGWEEFRVKIDAVCWFRREYVQGVDQDVILNLINQRMGGTGDEGPWLPSITYWIKELRHVDKAIPIPPESSTRYPGAQGADEGGGLSGAQVSAITQLVTERVIAGLSESGLLGGQPNGLERDPGGGLSGIREGDQQEFPGGGRGAEPADSGDLSGGQRGRAGSDDAGAGAGDGGPGDQQAGGDSGPDRGDGGHGTRTAGAGRGTDRPARKSTGKEA